MALDSPRRSYDASIAPAEIITTADVVAYNAAHHGDEGAAYIREDGVWREITWAQYYADAKQAARALVASGVPFQEPVAILGGNLYQWLISAAGAIMAGSPAVGVYATSAPPEVAYVVDHCEARMIIVENREQLEKVLGQWDQMPKLERVVLMEGAPPAGEERALSWEAFLALGSETNDDVIATRRAQTKGDQTSVIIYTSGTTSKPKGAMLSHDNVSYTSAMSEKMSSFQGDSTLSYLPLAHIAEQNVSFHSAIRTRTKVHFCREPLKLAEYLKEVRPHFFFGVPRVYERFTAALSEQLESAKGPKAKLLNWARDVGTKRALMLEAGRKPSGMLALQYKIADRLVFSKIRQAIGFDRVRLLLTGAAPTPKHVAETFMSVGILLHEVYGQTENTAICTMCTDDEFRFGTVGRPAPGTELKIAEDGEILVRNTGVFKGYFKAPDVTAETVVDGWLHTGDLGEIDADGFLKIIGRKKDIIITSGGKNIAPKAMESALAALPLVAQAVCVGDQRRHLVALLTIDLEAKARFAEERGVDPDTPEGLAAMHDALKRRIANDVNPNFARVGQIRNFMIVPQPFMPGDDEVTPTFKIKRPVIAKKYVAEFDRLYEEGEIL